MAQQRIHSMTQGHPTRLLLMFALPLMVGNVFQQLYTVVDTAVVGQFVGVSALASLGAADDFVPVSMSEENYRACRGEKSLYLVPGAGHAQSYATDTPGCQERIGAFLRAHGHGG